jgi:hypothetical protein
MIPSTLITIALAEYASRDDFHQIGKGSKIRHGLQWLFRAAVVGLACYLDNCLLYAVPLAFLFSAVFRWRLNGLRDDWWWYLGPMLDARGSKNSKYDSVFHWIAWTSSGQKKDHEGYYVYCDNRAGTLAYIFEAVVFVVGTVWYIWAR